MTTITKRFTLGDVEIVVCPSASAADELCSELQNGSSMPYWDIWVENESHRYCYASPEELQATFAAIRYSRITLDTSLAQVVAIARDCPLPMEVTEMATNNCIYRNPIKLEETEGVAWAPPLFQHLNSLYFWSPFMDDYHRLIQQLRQMGKADDFYHRNLRLANDGYCKRVSTYGLAAGGKYRWSVLHDFRHVATPVAAG